MFICCFLHRFVLLPVQGSKFKSILPVNNASSLVKKEIRSDSTKVFALAAIQISACYLSEPEPGFLFPFYVEVFRLLYVALVRQSVVF